VYKVYALVAENSNRNPQIQTVTSDSDSWIWAQIVTMAKTLVTVSCWFVSPFYVAAAAAAVDSLPLLRMQTRSMVAVALVLNGIDVAAAAAADVVDYTDS